MGTQGRRLSPEEQQRIWRLIEANMPLKVIARRLYLSIKTVRRYARERPKNIS